MQQLLLPLALTVIELLLLLLLLPTPSQGILPMGLQLAGQIL
jgi:hypothetical protein